MALSYQQPGLVLSPGQSGNTVADLQRDLRALGYLRAGVDGAFGPGTAKAVRALKLDLLSNGGKSSNGDGNAPVAMTDFNVDAAGAPIVATSAAITDAVDQPLVSAIAALLADNRVPKLPRTDDARAENARALTFVRAMPSASVPTPFVVAITHQESAWQHFHQGTGADADSYITVGLDHKDGTDRVTSRGYGIGQYTLFHHPPRAEEVADFMLDPLRNVQRCVTELRGKYDNAVTTKHNQADDRMAEHPDLSLRLCRYPAGDPRYMRDCKNCAVAARKLTITRGTSWYRGATGSYQPSQYHPSAEYSDVPDRADIPCDWPYAVRRYNGSGNDSYHYQTQVLKLLLTLPSSGS